MDLYIFSFIGALVGRFLGRFLARQTQARFQQMVLAGLLGGAVGGVVGVVAYLAVSFSIDPPLVFDPVAVIPFVLIIGAIGMGAAELVMAPFTLLRSEKKTRRNIDESPHN